MAACKINVTRPQFDASVFVAPTATVIGEVIVGPDVSIWYGAVVRGDMATITIGEGTNVQDNACIHVDPGVPVTIGRWVTIAHSAIVHGATIEDGALIGMGAIVLNGAVIGHGSLIAAGAVVRENMVVPPGSLVAGVPGKVIKELTPEQQAHMLDNARVYIGCAREHQGANSG